jgi:hypothetical protein
MTSLTADGDMLAVLSQVKDLAEIRDSSGKVIGFFAPIAIENAKAYANAAAHIDPMEIARQKSLNDKGKNTREVFVHLLSLTKKEEERAYLQKKIDSLRERDECTAP